MEMKIEFDYYLGVNYHRFYIYSEVLLVWLYSIAFAICNVHVIKFNKCDVSAWVT